MNRDMISITLLPGHSKEAVFIVKVKKAGLYQVMFVGRPAENIIEEREEIDSNSLRGDITQLIYAVDYISVIDDFS